MRAIGNVPGLIEQLGRKECLAPGGPTLEQAMLKAVRPDLLRILGAGGFGLRVPGLGSNASVARVTPPALARAILRA